MELLAAGATLVFAYAAGLLFRHKRVPDIPLLLGFGGVLAAAGIADVALVAQAVPVLAALALAMVLFDSAVEVGPTGMREHGRAGFLMAIIAFTLTTILCAGIAMAMTDLSTSAAVLLGMCFGGAGIVIIIPMARRVGLGAAGMGVLLMEAVVSDVMVILLVSSAATLLVAGLEASIAVAVALELGVALLGIPAGWAWGRILPKLSLENAYAVTLAALLSVYAGVEALHGSGPLAALLFGLLVARAMQGDELERNAHLIDFHHEAMFFVRAFFFVGLGATMRWGLLADIRFVLVGLLLAAGIVVGRGVASLSLQLPRRDRTIIAIMFPMGLVTAASSLLPQSMGVPGTVLLDEYAAVVIIITNLAAAVAVFVVGHDATSSSRT